MIAAAGFDMLFDAHNYVLSIENDLHIYETYAQCIHIIHIYVYIPTAIYWSQNKYPEF